MKEYDKQKPFTLIRVKGFFIFQLAIYKDKQMIEVRQDVVLYSSAKTGGQHKVPGKGMKFVNISPLAKAFVREFIKEQPPAHAGLRGAERNADPGS